MNISQLEMAQKHLLENPKKLFRLLKLDRPGCRRLPAYVKVTLPATENEPEAVVFISSEDLLQKLERR